jgi:hypothetical protein
MRILSVPARIVRGIRGLEVLPPMRYIATLLGLLILAERIGPRLRVVYVALQVKIVELALIFL